MKIDETKMTLAVDLTSQWPGGWLASEKLNGCRAYWTGTEFFTRGGNIIHAPKWFTKGLPKMHLDGEIHAGRDGKFGMKSFEVARVAVQHGGQWFNEVSPLTATPLCFSVFDAPEIPGTWRERMTEASRAVRKCTCADAVKFFRVNDTQWTGDANDYAELMLRFFRLGSEGLMFRNPDAIGYTAGRTANLLRDKFNQN